MNLQKISQKKKLFVLGIMNGTSLDGVDFVFTQVKKEAGGKSPISYVAEKSFSFPPTLKAQLQKAAQNKMLVHELGLLHHDLGRFYATCFHKLPPALKKVDLIGLHGQTVYHQAPLATLQIGESSYLSAVAGVPVVADFRSGDMALGGQGAPIATLFHLKAFAGKKRISLHNLGGISNLSMITEKGVEAAFDTGPANMLLDLCIQKISKGRKSFDLNGSLAKKGKPDLDVVEKLLAHPYFYKRPPKSCGREEFGEVFLTSFLKKAKSLSPADKMATLLEFTAWTIVLSYEQYLKKLPEKIIFCGGGAKNKALLERIQQLLPTVQVQTTEDYKWPVSSIEGAAFALLAAYKVWELPSNLPWTTGAQRKTSLGKVTLV